MNNGVIFNADSPTMDGYWYNPQTGDNFTVKDSFFEDGQYVVTTTDGRMLNYNQIQYYVKVDKPIIKPQEQQIPKEVSDLIGEDNLILSDEMDMIKNNNLGNMYSKPTQQTINDDYIIDKALSKRNLPNILIDIDWITFPKKEIDMLINIMDVSIKDIIEYYLDKVDIASIRECVARSVKQYIEDRYDSDLDLENIPATNELKKPSKPKNKKK